MADQAPKRPSVAFRSASPLEFAKVGHDPTATRQLAMVEMRTDHTKEWASAHYRKHAVLWEARELAKLITTDAGLSPNPKPVPKSADQKLLTLNEYKRQAHANVHGRAMRRIMKINHIKARMKNTIVNNANDPYLSPTFARVSRTELVIKPKIRRSRG